MDQTKRMLKQGLSIKNIESIFRKVVKIPLFVWGDLIYLIAHLVPKDKNLWVFGVWFGKEYADNSRYLFEYVNKNQPQIRAVWITNNKDVVERIRRRGYEAYLAYSFKGYLLSMRAKVAIISHSKTAALNRFAISSRTQIVQLWHGIPIKKIGYDDTVFTSKSQNSFFIRLIWAMQLFLFPFSKERFEMIIVTSDGTRDIFASAFKMDRERVKVTGYPRNDVFFRNGSSDCKSPDRKMINGIYMPTFRGQIGSGTDDLFIKYGFDIKEVEEFLKKHNIYLTIKLHPVNRPPSVNFEESENISLFGYDDVHEYFHRYDFLITDFSSVYFDYLLTDKPIIFTPFDMEDYTKNDREFYYNYEDVTPGPKAKNWHEVLCYIEEAVKYPEKYSQAREKTRKFFHRYVDGNSSERVFEAIKQQFA